MTAPIRHSIELNAVREFHLVCLVKLADLLRALGFPFKVSCVPLSAILYANVVCKFVFLKVCKLVLARRKSTPSSSQPCRGLSVRNVEPRGATGDSCRGGENRWG
jgi:hypothetical protein